MDSPHEDQYQQEKVNLVAGFIEQKAPSFHRAFAVPSLLNRSTMKYEPPEVTDLRETLACQHQKASKYVDFTKDLTICSWDQVLLELDKAKAAVQESERRGKNPIRWVYRGVGQTSSILAPGLAALPDELGILHGGLALIFSLARHSELNRLKILGAFENVPNIIELARDRAERFPLDPNKPKTVQLHHHARELQGTLLTILPALINKLVPGTWLNAWKSPFGGWKIDKMLESVKVCAEALRVCVEGMIEDLIVGSYSASMDIRDQLSEVIHYQKMIWGCVSAAAGTESKTQLLSFLMEQLSPNANGPYPPCQGDQSDLVSERGTALPGYTPEDLLKIIDVNHLRMASDEMQVLRRHSQLPPADVDRATQGMARALQDLLSSTETSNSTPGPAVVVVDGHFDRTQIGQISGLSYVCAMLPQALRRHAEQSYYNSSPETSPTNEKPLRPPPIIILQYFCSLHTSPDDDLSGPQGLIRCLCTQLLLSLVAYEWITPTSALDLPHLYVEGEEDLLSTRHIKAMCHLFAKLMQLVPEGVPVYIIVDSFSAYEREERDIEFGWREQYDMVVDAFRDSMDAGNAETGGNCVRLLITSPTKCRWLSEEFVLPGQRVSLRGWKEGSGVGGKNWRGVGGGRGRPGGLVGLARAATMPSPADDVGGGGGYPGYPGGGGGGGYQGGEYVGGYEQPQQQQQYYAQHQYTGQQAQSGGYDRRSST